MTYRQLPIPEGVSPLVPRSEPASINEAKLVEALARGAEKGHTDISKVGSAISPQRVAAFVACRKPVDLEGGELLKVWLTEHIIALEEVINSVTEFHHRKG